MPQELLNRDFAEKVVVVTGGATGIGAATAEAFAAASASVVIFDVSVDAARLTAEGIKRKGGRASFVECDVSSEQSVAGAVARVFADLGRVDILHANAAVESTCKGSELTIAEWNRVISVNLTGTFLVCRAVLPSMFARHTGCVLITSSPHALATVPDAAAYAASKGGALALMRSFALESAEHGVRVNAILPGAIDTPMVDREMRAAKDPEEQRKRLAASEPVGRLGTPREVADVALFLASDAASFITGSAYQVDGGLMAALPSGPPLSYNS